MLDQPLPDFLFLSSFSAGNQATGKKQEVEPIETGEVDMAGSTSKQQSPAE